jgi:hypothetical protein
MPQTDVAPQGQVDERWGRLAIKVVKSRLAKRFDERIDLKLSQGSCDQYVLELIKLGLEKADALAFAEWLFADLVRELFAHSEYRDKGKDGVAPADGEAPAGGPPAPPPGDDEIPF